MLTKTDKQDTIMVAIDSSTKSSGVAIFINGELSKQYLIDYTKTKAMEERLPKMVTSLKTLLSKYNADIVVCEEMVVNRNMQAMRFLIMVLGAIYSWCLDNDAEYLTLRPTVWRSKLKLNGGKREELKKKSIQYVKDNFNLNVNDDVADAICIGEAYKKEFSDE